jgi:hypothetical protein
MKTSVTKIMMSFALMGCLIFGASDAMAHGRSRDHGGSTSSRSQSAAVSRSNNNSSAQTVNRNSSSSVSRSSSTPQVSRSSSSVSHSSSTPQVSRSSSSVSRSSSTPQVSHSSSSVSRSSSTPQVTHNSSSSVSRNATTPQVTRSSSTRTNDSGTSVTRGATTRSSNKGTTTGPSAPTITHNDKSVNPNANHKSGSMDKPNINKGGMDKPGDNKGNYDNDRNGKRNNDRSGNKGNRPGNNGNDRNVNKGNKGHDNNRHGDGGRHGGNRGYNPNHRYDYSNHHYRNEFSWNFSHHNWSRPLPPPARAHRPAPLIWSRPVIPVGWHPYAGAPVIDRILGLMFGTLYYDSLDFLYNSGYYIDGYANGIIYLRDVPLLNLYWSDVMLNYELDRLANAQFIYHSSYYDRTRFDRVYNSLCRIYGSPVFNDGMTISWYGGGNTGWVTLTMNDSYGDYYTTISIGY